YLIARLDRTGPGNEREVVTSHPSSGYLDDRPLAMRKLSRGELVGLEDRHDLGDAGVALEPEPLHVLAVADRPDHGDLFAARQVRARSAALDPPYDGLDVFLGGRRLHHDHHFSCLLR